jgi:hypothetical protein
VLFTAERLGWTETGVKEKVKIFLGKGKTVGFAQENGGKIFERGTPGEVKNRFLRRGNVVGKASCRNLPCLAKYLV